MQSPLTILDIDIILEMLPDDMLQKQKDVKTKLVLMKRLMQANDEFQKKMLDIRKAFEELNK
ncbi:MAG: hypothetical protein IJ093_00550 [Bacilli bacterium]|nr:hypothetical protein [Bacilli bacterium]